MLPRLGHTVLILVQVVSKLYLFIAVLLLCPANQPSDVLMLLPSMLLCSTLILGALDVRTSVILLSSI
jgi:hypothetical protein